MAEPEARLDIDLPHAARIWNYWMGGEDNFPSDRAAGEAVAGVYPEIVIMARQSRGFLIRAVRHLAAEAGVRQFLDIGSGLPTDTNVHQVAHEVDPAAKVVYVDHDPMVLVHGRALLADEKTTTVIEADLRRPGEILGHRVVRERIDFTEPVGLLLLSVLHHVHDSEDPVGITGTLREALPSGSHLAILHFWDSADEHPRISEKARQAEQLFNDIMGTGCWRRRAEIQHRDRQIRHRRPVQPRLHRTALTVDPQRSGQDGGRLGDSGLHLVGCCPDRRVVHRQHQPGQRGRTATDPGLRHGRFGRRRHRASRRRRRAPSPGAPPRACATACR